MNSKLSTLAKYTLGKVLPTVVCSDAVTWLELGSLFRCGLRKGLYIERIPKVENSVERPNISSVIDRQSLVRIALYSICIELEKLPNELDFKDVTTNAALEKRLRILENQVAVVSKYFDNARPKLAIIVQGYEEQSAIMREIAIDRNIPILALENTALNDRILWDNLSGITTNRNLSKNFYWRYEGNISNSTAQAYCEELVSNTKQRKNAEHISPDDKLELPFKGEFGLFLGQVYTDSSILFGLGNWDSPESVVEQFLLACRAHGLKAILKLHPKEKSGVAPITHQPYEQLTWRKLNSHPGVVNLINNSDLVFVDHNNELDTYKLIEKARITSTITSQSGLEALIRRKPCVVCGRAFYADLGFSFDANQDTFQKVFENAMLHEDLDARTTEAQKFTYSHFEKYCRPKSGDNVVHLAKACVASSQIWKD